MTNKIRFHLRGVIITREVLQSNPVPLQLWRDFKVSQIATVMKAGYEVCNPGRQLPSNLKVYDPERKRVLDTNMLVSKAGLKEESIIVVTNLEDNVTLEGILDVLKLSAYWSRRKHKNKVIRLIRALVRGIPWVGPALETLLFKG